MRVVIIDGYNVLRSSQRYTAQLHHAGCKGDYGSDAYNAAREALLNDACAFAANDDKVIIVFDAAGNTSLCDRTSIIANIEVIFSPAGVSADAVIERRARDAADAGNSVLVVSSDANIQWTVLGKNVSRMSVLSFIGELERTKDEYASEQKLETSKTTLAERINPDVAARLAALARKS